MDLPQPTRLAYKRKRNIVNRSPAKDRDVVRPVAATGTFAFVPAPHIARTSRHTSGNHPHILTVHDIGEFE